MGTFKTRNLQSADLCQGCVVQQCEAHSSCHVNFTFSSDSSMCDMMSSWTRFKHCGIQLTGLGVLAIGMIIKCC
jgi:hypothetical protein